MSPTGPVAPAVPPDELFYPDLRRHAAEPRRDARRDRVRDQRVGRERQVRTVLLGRAERQDRGRAARRSEPLHVGPREVGDPRAATAARAAAYLDAWADVLVESWSAPDAK